MKMFLTILEVLIWTTIGVFMIIAHPYLAFGWFFMNGFLMVASFLKIKELKARE